MELLKLKNVKSAKIEANWDLQFKFRIRDFMLNNIDIYTDSNVSNTDTNRSKL